MLQAIDLHKSYCLHGTTLPILNGVSFEAQKGETIAIVGRSGAGKSTLLHLLGGLDRPTTGDVIIGDKSLYHISTRQRARLRAEQIGFVFQAYHLLPEMNITENVMLPAMAIHTLSRKAMYARAEQLLVDVGLKDRLKHCPQELSGGEQQRVAIARAMMNQPPLILADEPTGNLDAKTGMEILELLFKLAQDQGTILVMVTHSTETAAKCSRTLTLQTGVLI